MTGSSLHEMARCLGGEVHGGRISCPGPGHSPKDRSLSVWFDREGTLHCNSFAGDDWRSCMDDVRFRLGLPAFDPEKKQEASKPAHRQHLNEEIERRSQEQKTALVRRLWAESLDPRGTLVQAYLAGRGLELPGEVAGRTIRFHPACPFEGNGRVPVMLARYSPIMETSIPRHRRAPFTALR